MDDINAKYASVRERLQSAPPLTSKRIHAGMYGVKDSSGNLWRVFELEKIEDFGGWIAVDFDNDHGEYTDNMPTKRDVLRLLGFDA